MSIGIYKQTAQDIMSSHVVAIHVLLSPEIPDVWASSLRRT